jgi:hypothetical protein
VPLPIPDDPEPLPGVAINIDASSTVIVPGEDFVDLWHALVLRGAVAQSEFPGEMNKHRNEIARLLLRLRYIEPIHLQGEDGLRLVPIPSPNSPVLVAVR